MCNDTGGGRPTQATGVLLQRAVLLKLDRARMTTRGSPNEAHQMLCEVACTRLARAGREQGRAPWVIRGSTTTGEMQLRHQAAAMKDQDVVTICGSGHWTSRASADGVRGGGGTRCTRMVDERGGPKREGRRDGRKADPRVEPGKSRQSSRRPKGHMNTDE